jgi:broad specificity phosphatase PhoE
MSHDLYLVRHGQTLFNRKQMISGWTDSPLTELGVEQARRAGEFLRHRGLVFDHAHVSTLTRTHATLRAVMPGIPFEEHDGLREWYFGEYEAERMSIMPARPWGEYFVPFGGEAQMEVRARVVDTLTQIMERETVDPVLAVSHGSAIREFHDAVVTDSEEAKRGVPGNAATLHFTFEDSAFALKEIFTQEDYAAELGIEPL